MRGGFVRILERFAATSQCDWPGYRNDFGHFDADIPVHLLPIVEFEIVVQQRLNLDFNDRLQRRTPCRTPGARSFVPGLQAENIEAVG